ncbi:hypothetical protein H4696_002290 [Amycolatopsis lexingtonensis]|uniref:Uncharacterized protein n=1 Tax=Amycolatopsis lexingtonensis TaxID=218822 RepID=A0ABR9HW76_9PSEU|nr:hypothetical protein [Amycolatopsis lexingtonensis]MBE1495190.1 hypothetical protein [Amycolatopsis lexingtonensis]
MLLPGATTVIGQPLAARCRTHAVVKSPPTQVPSGKQTTARVLLRSAWKPPTSTCSNRRATCSSSSSARGQMVGRPLEPEETAIMSSSSKVPPRHNSGSGYFRW